MHLESVPPPYVCVVGESEGEGGEVSGEGEEGEEGGAPFGPGSRIDTHWGKKGGMGDATDLFSSSRFVCYFVLFVCLFLRLFTCSLGSFFGAIFHFCSIVCMFRCPFLLIKAGFRSPFSRNLWPKRTRKTILWQKLLQSGHTRVTLAMP